jgi:Flp pilus assembly protein TadD
MLWSAGMGYKMLGRREPAYRAFKHAYAIEQENAEIGRQLVAACLALGGTQEAVAVAAEVSSMHPDDAGLLANLGLALLADGRVDDAETVVQRALAMDESDPVTRRLWRVVRERAQALRGRAPE